MALTPAQRGELADQIFDSVTVPGYAYADACEAVRAIEPLVTQMLAGAWDEGRRAERRDWDFTFDLATPDEDRQPWPNPYRTT